MFQSTTPQSSAAPTPTPARPTTRSGGWVWLTAALLALVTTAVFWPATQCDFVNYDDFDYVTRNAHATSGLTLENARWAFRSGYASNWHPLTWLSHMADCQFFGLNPWGHHLTSVLWHAVNTALAFLLLRRLTGAFWRSILVAALFGLHPLHVESVAWVAERKDLLSAFFFLLALLCYVRYAEGRMQNAECRMQNEKRQRDKPASLPRPPSGLLAHSPTCSPAWHPIPRYFLSLVFFCCALMSKPMVVTLPFVLLLLDYWPLRRFELSTLNSQLSTAWRLVLEKLPFFALAAAASMVTFLVQGHAGAVAAVEKLPLGPRIGNALISYCRYLGKLFWPTDLAVFYPHPGYWPRGQVWLAGGLLLALSVFVYVKRRRFPFWPMGWLWFCGTLVPVIGLVQVGEQAMADRYAYIPSLGMLILTVWSAYELSRGWRYGLLASSVAGSAAVVVCMVLTRQQLGYWKDGEALFRHAVAVTRNNLVSRYNLGIALDKKGQINEAMRQYQEAIRLRPDATDARDNLGIVLYKKGQTDEAISRFQEVLRLKPDDAEAHYNLGIAFAGKGQTDDAIVQFQEALRFKPNDADAHNNFGASLLRRGRIEESIGHFREALRLAPADADAHYNLGMALGRQGQTDEAIRHYEETIRLQPDYAEAHNKLGRALLTRGQTQQAINQLQKALRLKPDDAETHAELGAALLKQGQADEAIRQFQEALRLQPDNPTAHDNLGVALLHKGKTDEAILQFHEALRLQPDNATAHNNLGTALDLQGHNDEAVVQFQEALRLNPDYAEACNNLGYKWAERGKNLDQARALIEKAVRLEPTNAAFLDSLGWVLFKLNRPGEGLAYLLKAIERSGRPGAGLYDHVGDVYAALNQREQAAEAWRKSLSLKPSQEIRKKLGEASPQ